MFPTATRPTRTCHTARAASHAQIAYITSLSPHDRDGLVDAALTEFGATRIQNLTMAQAGALLDELIPAARAAQAAERAAARAQASAITPGMYTTSDGTPVKVYEGQRSGWMLAKKLTRDGWVYLGAATRFVTADRRMTVEQAQQYGVDSGVCVCCGRTLTDPESVAAGIGPVCAAKYF